MAFSFGFGGFLASTRLVSPPNKSIGLTFLGDVRVLNLLSFSFLPFGEEVVAALATVAGLLSVLDFFAFETCGDSGTSTSSSSLDINMRAFRFMGSSFFELFTPPLPPPLALLLADESNFFKNEVMV